MQAVDVGCPWGIIARFTDVGGLLPRFADKGMSLVEFPVSDRDLDRGIEGFQPSNYPFGLVVHAPEYFHDHLIDLCAPDDEHRRVSVGRIQKTIDLARQLASWFEGVSDPGPKVIMHVGGMSPQPGAYDVVRATEYLLDSLRRLDIAGVDLLLENLPPFPWYFGGRWFGHILVDAVTTARLCNASGLGLCFDTSHAALECHRSGLSLKDFGQLVSPYVRHLHLSDAAGVSGEGLQIGEGGIIIIDNEKYAEAVRKVGGHGFKNLRAEEGRIRLNQDVFQNPDCIIIATALYLNVPVVTGDKDFRKVKELDLIVYEK